MDKNRIVGASPIEMDYEEHYELYQRSILTEKEWKKYCQTTLEKLMLENKGVLTRLKE